MNDTLQTVIAEVEKKNAAFIQDGIKKLTQHSKQFLTLRTTISALYNQYEKMDKALQAIDIQSIKSSHLPLSKPQSTLIQSVKTPNKS